MAQSPRGLWHYGARATNEKIRPERPGRSNDIQRLARSRAERHYINGNRSRGTEVDMRLIFRHQALFLAPIVCFGLIPLGAVETGVSITRSPDAGPPASVRMIGDTEKVCQLTGDKDWDTGQPTAARTLSNFGLDATDLGYPVEHNGKLII